MHVWILIVHSHLRLNLLYLFLQREVALVVVTAYIWLLETFWWNHFWFSLFRVNDCLFLFLSKLLFGDVYLRVLISFFWSKTWNLRFLCFTYCSSIIGSIWGIAFVSIPRDSVAALCMDYGYFDSTQVGFSASLMFFDTFSIQFFQFLVSKIRNVDFWLLFSSFCIRPFDETIHDHWFMVGWCSHSTVWSRIGALNTSAQLLLLLGNAGDGKIVVMCGGLCLKKVLIISIRAPSFGTYVKFSEK